MPPSLEIDRLGKTDRADAGRGVRALEHVSLAVWRGRVRLCDRPQRVRESNLFGSGSGPIPGYQGHGLIEGSLVNRIHQRIGMDFQFTIATCTPCR